MELINKIMVNWRPPKNSGLITLRRLNYCIAYDPRLNSFRSLLTLSQRPPYNVVPEQLAFKVNH